MDSQSPASAEYGQLLTASQLDPLGRLFSSCELRLPSLLVKHGSTSQGKNVFDLALLWQYTSYMSSDRTKRTYETPLQVRVSPEQHAIFQKAAKKDGRSLSSWVRDRLAKAARKELK